MNDFSFNITNPLQMYVILALFGRSFRVYWRNIRKDDF